MGKDLKPWRSMVLEEKWVTFILFSCNFKICIEINKPLTCIFLEFFLLTYSKIMKRLMYLDTYCSIV